ANRIVGYTFTVGLVQAMTTYLVVRYTAYHDEMRVRMDGIAYCLASAVGYVTVLNLDYVLSTPAPVDAIALRVFNNASLLYATAIIVGYGLGEVRFGQPTPLLLTLTLALGATLTGIVVPLRAGLSNATLTLAPAIASPIHGFALSAVVLLGVSLAIAFL